MTKVTARVVNLPELQGKLNALKKAARGDALRRSAMAGGFVVESYAKINVERTFSGESTGAAGLGGSIQTVISESGGNYAEASIGPTVVYGRIHELGGWIKPVHTKMLHWIEDGLDIFAKAVYIPARPYLRPAVDEHEDDIRTAVGESLKADILRATK